MYEAKPLLLKLTSLQRVVKNQNSSDEIKNKEDDLILIKNWIVMSYKMIIGTKDEESGFLPCLATRTKQNTGNYFYVVLNIHLPIY